MGTKSWNCSHVVSLNQLSIMNLVHDSINIDRTYFKIGLWSHEIEFALQFENCNSFDQMQQSREKKDSSASGESSKMLMNLQTDIKFSVPCRNAFSYSMYTPLTPKLWVWQYTNMLTVDTWLTTHKEQRRNGPQANENSKPSTLNSQ